MPGCGILESTLKRFGDLESVEARLAFLDEVNAWLGEDVDDKGLDNVDKKLEEHGVPSLIADQIENLLQKYVQGKADDLRDELTQLLDSQTPVDVAQLTAAFQERLIDPIFNFGRQCDLLKVWIPEVLVSASPDGATFNLTNTYLHWAFATERIE